MLVNIYLSIQEINLYFAVFYLASLLLDEVPEPYKSYIGNREPPQKPSKN